MKTKGLTGRRRVRAGRCGIARHPDHMGQWRTNATCMVRGWPVRKKYGFARRVFAGHDSANRSPWPRCLRRLTLIDGCSGHAWSFCWICWFCWFLLGVGWVITWADRGTDRSAATKPPTAVDLVRALARTGKAVVTHPIRSSPVRTGDSNSSAMPQGHLQSVRGIR